jgi:hypothetical protein
MTLEPDRIYWLGPGELAYFKLGVSPTGIRGEQRNPIADSEGRKKIRDIADAIKAGKAIPSVTVALDEHGTEHLRLCRSELSLGQHALRSEV